MQVSIEQSYGRYRVLVDGEVYPVNGAGMVFSEPDDIATLAQQGGNTFRTWGTADLDTQLEVAGDNDLKVLVGLDVAKQLDGFDYNDPAAVAEQYQRATATIDEYKDDPSVLGWVLANEANLLFDGSGNAVPPDPQVYTALNDILDYIHENDPNHPATVTLAFTESLESDITTALERMPSLDFISLQTYGALPAVPDAVTSMSGDWPFMITEYGPLGHWEVPTTDWGREIEEPSAVKAAGMVERMTPAIDGDPTGRLIGSFAFLWGQKQERTPTWYGLFTKSGERTTSVDELRRFWTGEYPPNRAPGATAISLDGRQPTESIRLSPGESARVVVDVTDPEGEVMTPRWELMEEVGIRSEGGAFESEPAVLPIDIREESVSAGQISGVFDAPVIAGDYRVYLYAADGQGGVATANLPFRVE